MSDVLFLSPLPNTIQAADLRALVGAVAGELNRHPGYRSELEDLSSLYGELVGSRPATPTEIIRYNQGAIALAQLRDAQKKRLRLALGIGSGVVGLGVAIYVFSVLRK